MTSAHAGGRVFGLPANWALRRLARTQKWSHEISISNGAAAWPSGARGWVAAGDVGSVDQPGRHRCPGRQHLRKPRGRFQDYQAGWMAISFSPYGGAKP